MNIVLHSATASARRRKNASVGDRVVARSEQQESRPWRAGIVEDVGYVTLLRYRVGWEDGTRSVLTPASGGAWIEQFEETSTDDVRDSSYEIESIPELFRRVNDRIRELGQSDGRYYDFVCECADDECTKRLQMTEIEYDAVQTSLDQFIVLPGHEHSNGSNRVIARAERYVVVSFAESGPPAETRDVTVDQFSALR
ncbi:MAG: hypothetical protein ACXVJ3_20885 [Ilumatobacteraceae bacterium]